MTHPTTVGAAMAGNDSLASLVGRARHSEQLFTIVKQHLPPELVAQVRPGGLDAGSWVLMADNAAAGAKLRQYLPTLLAVVQTTTIETNRSQACLPSPLEAAQAQGLFTIKVKVKPKSNLA